MSDCGRCGAWLESSHPGDVFYDGDVIACECGTTNSISVDDDANPEAWVHHWVCAHGTSSDDPCPACDAEDDGAARSRRAKEDAGRVVGSRTANETESTSRPDTGTARAKEDGRHG